MAARHLHRPGSGWTLSAWGRASPQDASRGFLPRGFGSSQSSGELFIPPIIRAILLHFTLAYDHPFVDGNGRVARALFYWSALSGGYRLLEFVSISRVLRQAPAKYARSYLFTETDDSDVTYFIVHRLATVIRAIDEFHA